MDCADDAARLEKAVRKVAGAEAARVSAASHILYIPSSAGSVHAAVIEAAAAGLGYRLETLGSYTTNAPRADYARALRIVVGLNLGYGIVESVGGFWAGSQALKADALDFVGDGLITLLGLIALAWTTAWRARAALLQGLFLGALGIAVLGNTLYRAVFQQLPHSSAMGILAAVALCVNVASAVVLLPYRSGDANVRAVWLFSRNDALGNIAVLAAAALVALTGSAWPDLVVGSLVALLFLHSSWAIIRDARQDLAEA
jgi:cation diffusion facilitator family transporter